MEALKHFIQVYIACNWQSQNLKPDLYDKSPSSHSFHSHHFFLSEILMTFIVQRSVQFVIVNNVHPRKCLLSLPDFSGEWPLEIF